MDRIKVVVLISVLVVFGGMALAYYPDPCDYDVVFSENDGDYQFQFVSNMDVEATAVLISNMGSFNIDSVVACYDPAYYSLNPLELQSSFFDIMKTHLEMRSISDFRVFDSQQMLEAMDDLDPSNTALLFAAGSIPGVLYNGTDDCPVMDWLSRGGIVINVAGCLGLYYSESQSEDGLVKVDGFGRLFADVDDDCFSNSSEKIYAFGNSVFHEWLHADISECTYGVRVSDLSDALNLGYVSDEGYSSACVFKSQNGMVFNFGCSLTDYNHISGNIAQYIASGIDYSSELVDRIVCDSNSGGHFVVDSSCSIFCFIGSSRVLYADRMQIF